MKWYWLLIHLSCTAALLFQLGSVLRGYIKPSMTNIKEGKRSLSDKEFPLILKICVTPVYNNSVFNSAGYDIDNANGYRYGVSKFNSSIFGWAGHTNESGIENRSVDGFVEKISFLKISDAIKWVKFYSPDAASDLY